MKLAGGGLTRWCWAIPLFAKKKKTPPLLGVFQTGACREYEKTT